MHVDSRGFLHSSRHRHDDRDDAVRSSLPRRGVLHADDIVDVGCDNGHTNHRIVNSAAMIAVCTWLLPAAVPLFACHGLNN